MGSDVINYEKTTKRANLREILDSHLKSEEVEFPEIDGLFKVRYLGAIEREEGMIRFPMPESSLTPEENSVFRIASRKRVGCTSDESWFAKLSDAEKEVVLKMGNSDNDAIPRYAHYISLIVEDPKMTEQDALTIIRRFKNPMSLPKLIYILNKFITPPEALELKN
jgi:hypothetical protein